MKTIVIITYGRSGSTLLQKVIGSIPGAHMAGENNNAIYGLYDSYKRISRAKENFGKESRGYDDPWYMIDKVDTDDYAFCLTDLFVKKIINPNGGARIVGFKEIRFFENLEEFSGLISFVLNYFENAKIIFNVRDHDEVCKSGWWAAENPEVVKKELAKFENLMNEALGCFPKSTYKVNYNNYLENPDVLREMFEFIGEEYCRKKVCEVLRKKLTH